MSGADDETHFLPDDAGASPPPEPGTPTIPGYVVGDVLGAGGMGVVYRALQLVPQREVAIKVLQAGALEPTLQRLFQREIEVLARLVHPSIAGIHGAGVTEEGQPFFSMELVDGVTLTEHAARQTGSPRAVLRERVELGVQLCDAIHHAHQRGVIHRDLKPANVLVTTVDGAPRVKVLDFGLARLTDADLGPGGTQTRFGVVQGTIPYMSPEQARGDPAAIDIRTDVYALGVILYQLLGGALPYEVAGTPLPKALEIICEQPPRPAGLDRDLETIVQTALEKDPARRYLSAAALAGDLERYLAGQPILARPPSTLYQLRKLLARHRLLVGLVLLVVVAATSFAVVATLGARRERQLREAAVAAQTEALEDAARARQVGDFLVELFRAADPFTPGGDPRARALDLLDRGVARLQGTAGPARTHLLEALARSYLSLGATGRARPLAEEALGQLERQAGIEQIIEGRALLGQILVAAGDLPGARQQLDRALEEGEAGLGPEHPALAEVHRGRARLRLAAGELDGALQASDAALRLTPAAEVLPLQRDRVRILQALGQLEEAEQLQRQIVAASQDEPRLADLHRLALLREARHDLPGVEELRRQELELARTQLGAGDPVPGLILADLADLREARGDPVGAAALFQQSLEQLRDGVGEQHPGVGRALLGLARLARHRGDYRAAEAHLRAALPHGPAAARELGALLARTGRAAEARRVVEDLEGVEALVSHDDRPDAQIADDLTRLGLRHLAAGRPDQAAESLEQALATWARLRGEDHPEHAMALGRLAAARLQQDRLEEAGRLLQRHLEGLRATLGPEHPMVAQGLTLAGELELARGATAAAEARFHEALARLRRRPVAVPEDEAALLGRLGRIRMARGDPAGALQLHGQALGLLQGRYSEDDPRLALVMGEVAAALVDLGQPAQAEPLALGSLRILEGALGPDHPDTGAARLRLVALYEAWGRPERADPYR
jgi:tetratricopeptide (TPR) repeat protein